VRRQAQTKLIEVEGKPGHCALALGSQACDAF
jgi:hypothetical protein